MFLYVFIVFLYILSICFYVFCVGVESESNKHLAKIFGNKNYFIIKSASELPEKLPLIYLSLSK